MPHRLFDWRVRIRAALREYQAVRIGLDLLVEATADEVHELTEARAWDDLAAAEIYAAENNLDATYMIRMYSVFERAVASFWRDMPGNEDRTVAGDELLDEVGSARLIDEDVIRNAQEVRPRGFARWPTNLCSWNCTGRSRPESRPRRSPGSCGSTGNKA